MFRDAVHHRSNNWNCSNCQNAAYWLPLSHQQFFFDCDLILQSMLGFTGPCRQDVTKTWQCHQILVICLESCPVMCRLGESPVGTNLSVTTHARRPISVSLQQTNTRYPKVTSTTFHQLISWSHWKPTHPTMDIMAPRANWAAPPASPTSQQHPLAPQPTW